MKKLPQYLLQLLVLITIACNENGNEVKIVYDTIDVDTTLMPNSELPAKIYSGILPCSDCDGIQTDISIYDGLNFQLTEVYLGKSDTIFNCNGKITEQASAQLENEKIYQLVFENSLPNRYFKVIGDSSLQQLDDKGQEIMSTQNIILKRK